MEGADLRMMKAVCVVLLPVVWVTGTHSEDSGRPMEEGGRNLSVYGSGAWCLFACLFVLFFFFCLANILRREERVTPTEEPPSANGVLLSLSRAAFIFIVSYLFINLESEILFWLWGDKSSRSQGNCFQMLSVLPPTSRKVFIPGIVSLAGGVTT